MTAIVELSLFAAILLVMVRAVVILRRLHQEAILIRGMLNGICEAIWAVARETGKR